jgi:hypothetical protein
MHNYIYLFLGVLVEAKLLTKDEATALSKEFATATIPDNFEGAYNLVKDVFETAEITKKAISTK